MKTLYLVRHAEAVARHQNKPDIERSLTKAGVKDAQKMARKVKKDSVPDVLISSTARRAIETARIFAKEFKSSKKAIVENKSIYSARNAEALLKVVHQIDDAQDSAMIFGHDPRFSEFANFLRRTFTETIPKCGVVCFEFNNVSWSKISKGRGVVKFVDYPGKQKMEAARRKKELAEKIAEQIKKSLAGEDAQTAAKLNKAIGKASKGLAQGFLQQQKSAKKEKKQKMKGNKSPTK